MHSINKTPPAPPAPQPVEAYHDVTADRFCTDVRPLQRPAILKGVAASWPSVRAGRQGPDAFAACLRPLYSGAPIQAFRAPPATGGRLHYTDGLDGFNFTRQQTRLDRLLDDLCALAPCEAPDALYAGSLPLPVIAPEMARSHRLDGFIHAENVLQSLWIGNRTRVAVHYDQAENLAVVVAGRRRFTLFPMQCVADLYLGPIDLTPAGQPVSLVDTAAPDFDRFPRYRAALAQCQVAELEPGDAIYLPALWLHGVEALDPVNALINFWWKTTPGYFENPFNTLLHAVLSIKSLPDAERQRWRSLFDLLVFQPDHQGQDHLPEAARGMFGTLTPDKAQALRTFLIQGLQGKLP